MNRNLLTPVVLLFWVTAIVSCKSSDKHAIAVPKDAAIVFHINTPSLASKLSWEDIKATKWFSKLESEADDSLAKKMLENPQNSGINTQKDLAFLITRRGKGGYLTFQGSLSDAGAFEAFNNKVNKNTIVAKEGDLTIMRNKDNEESIVAWNNERFFYVASVPFFALMNAGERGDYFEAMEKSKLGYDSLVAIAKELFNLGKNTLYDDKRFAELMQESGDFHMWINNEMYMGNSLSLASMITNIDKLFKGNVGAATGSFENGKLVMDIKSYYNKDLAAVYAKHKWSKVNADLINSIPSQNVTGFCAFAVPPAVLKDMFKLIGIDGMVNSFLSEINYSMEEFEKANKGDLLIAVTDFQIKEEKVTLPGMDGQDFSYTKSEPDMKVLFASSINDKAAFNKMADLIRQKAGAGLLDQMVPGLTTGTSDKWFAASNSQEFVDKFLAGPGGNKLAIADKLSGNQFVLYVDIQKILAAIPASDGEKSAIAKDESLQMWQDLSFTGQFAEGGETATARFEVNLVDKNTNSLKQLNTYIDKLASAFTAQ
jgi:hypothetical protein